ncbi:hypothetical protein HNW13_010375 [Shewanella sp. BF02_Schw]|uniref:hypothetical protein n=1 Tax=Shewanella sp. BF02_Schw TaxID=394908 RepID=UPI0017869FC0|nr:hypothetical protein [Shewanella sp. BF02_Schw]MBO1896174.1 hypothetical protein [Shewanella sp. BF02_Schw]
MMKDKSNSTSKVKGYICMKKIRQALLILIPLMLLFSCNYKKTMTPEEEQQVISLQQELQKIDNEISIATSEIAEYSGGLIKATKEVRQETLKLTRDIINQRIQSIESGAKVTITVPVTQPSEEIAASLITEIEHAKSQLLLAKDKAESYSGGLLAALSLSTVATQEQTLALLEQKYLISKYGLSFSLHQTVADSSSASQLSTSNKPELKNTATEITPNIENETMLIADGPFGLAMGMTKDMFNGRLAQAGNGIYLLKKPPVPHPEFETYAVKISAKSGLCWIKGVGKNIETNRYGLQIKSAFDEFETKLNQRYGLNKRNDFLMPGSLWKEPEDWMMGLKKSDRYLMTIWKGSDKPLPNDLSSIALIAQADSTNSGYLALEYSFSNKDVCDKEIDQQNDAGL